MVPVQFITHQTERFSYEESALLALRGGCRWIQLRMKEATDDDVAPVAERLREACTKAGATFIVDDRVELAKEVKADGVHLGKNDMPIAEARRKPAAIVRSDPPPGARRSSGNGDHRLNL